MDREERIENKLDKMAEDIGRINVTLEGQHQSLVQHMRRADLLEERFVPIENHVLLVNAVAKVLGMIFVVIGFFASIFEILAYFKK